MVASYLKPGGESSVQQFALTCLLKLTNRFERCKEYVDARRLGTCLMLTVNGRRVEELLKPFQVDRRQELQARSCEYATLLKDEFGELRYVVIYFSGLVVCKNNFCHV